MKYFILLAVVCFPVFSMASQEQADLWYREINGDGSCSERDVSCDAGRLRARLFGNRFSNLSRMASEINRDIDGIIWISVINLDKKGFPKEAQELISEWNDHYGEIEAIVSRSNGKYDFKDFAPLNLWLSKVTAKLLHILGWEVFYALRISDLDTYNYGLPVLFNPCFYGEKEWTIAFCHDPDKPQKYRGLAPVTSYWSTDITCGIATYGAGWAFVCGPISMVVERFVDWKIAPALAPKLWERFCK